MQTQKLKDLKATAKQLGVKGTTSRTKYTKHNKPLLVAAIKEAEEASEIGVFSNSFKVYPSVKSVPPRGLVESRGFRR